MSAADRDPSPTAVVTGASGWLGQNLVRALAPARERVRCLVPAAEEGALLDLAGPSVEVVVGDVRDPATIDHLFDGTSGAATTVFHAAGVIHPKGRTRELFDVNVGGTQLVVDRARRHGARRLLHVSSNSPFGANERPTDRFTEDSPFDPYLSYGKSKLEAEDIVRRAGERGDVETVILRPPWFYGPYQPARQTQWLATVRRGRFPLVGDGRQQRSMVFTGNLVHGLLRAEATEAAAGRAYWIADAEPHELREVFATVRRAFEAEGLPVSGSRQLRLPRLAGLVAERLDTALQGTGRYSQAIHVLGELKDTIACDISLARAELGYDPPTDLFSGMRASIRWCLERGQAL